ncbi:MAG TPA: ATP-binding protein [Anaerolineae bacterium]|nr:ATP-binding protein [Anaerolineae bacterium]
MSEPTFLTLSPILERALLYVAVAIATLVAFTHWRRGDTRAFREPLIAFVALWFVEGALSAVTAEPSLAPAALVRGLDFASILLLAWAFLAASLPARANGVMLGTGLTLTAAFSAFSISAARATGSEPGWIGDAWSGGTLAVAAAAALTLTLRRSPDRTSGSIAAFAGLAASAALALLRLPDLSRISQLMAFYLFPLGLYQRALSDLRTTQDTLREFSQSALTQTQELVTLLEASAYLFTSLDLEELLSQVVEHAALGIEADRALIALIDADNPQIGRVVSSYPRGQYDVGAAFAIGGQPALTLAVTGGEQIVVGPRGHGFSALTRWLRSNPLSPVIVQPLATQNNTLGLLAAADSRRRHEFSQGQRRLLESLGAQIAAAIENARLYRQLDTQARELARVLAARDEEVGWRAAALEAVIDGVLVTNRSDQIILANSAALRIADIPHDQLLNRSIGVLFERLTPLSHSPLLGASGATVNADVMRAVFAFGDRIVHASLAPMLNLLGERLGLVILLRDVTHEHHSAVARSEFVGSIAREFRTPLATIKGYADLLSKGSAGELPPAALGFVETIRAHAERLSAQVNAIAQFNELDRGRIELSIEEADMASLLTEAADAVRARFQARGLALELDVRPNLPSVRVDRARVRQVIDQLIDNALKFTPDGGQITLSAAPAWDGQSAERPASVAVAVSDTGIGFDPRDSERIFEAFYRGQNPQQVDQAGLGIGLSIARGVCEAMGGHLWASTEPGHGSVFTFLLPVARVTDARLAGAAPDETSLDSWIEHALSLFGDEGTTNH